MLVFLLGISYSIGTEQAENPTREQRIEALENSVISIEEYLQELTKTLDSGQ